MRLRKKPANLLECRLTSAYSSMRLTASYVLRFKEIRTLDPCERRRIAQTSMILEQIPQFQHCRLGVMQIVPVNHGRANSVVRF